MIALQLLLFISAVVGMIMAPFEFRRARSAYFNWRDGGTNGFTLQVAAHQVRLAVANVMIHASLLMLTLLALYIMLTGWKAESLDMVLMVLATMLSIQLMASQAMSRYDYGLVADQALMEYRKSKEAKLPPPAQELTGRAEYKASLK